MNRGVPGWCPYNADGGQKRFERYGEVARTLAARQVENLSPAGRFRLDR
jgi:hypothetical protein